MSSGSGFRVAALHAAYGASKAGVVALTKAAASEGAPHGVTANVVAPGFVDTPMTRRLFPTDEEMQNVAVASPIANPMGRPLRAEELAHAIWFLDASRQQGHHRPDDPRQQRGVDDLADFSTSSWSRSVPGGVGPHGLGGVGKDQKIENEGEHRQVGGQEERSGDDSDGIAA